MADSWQLINNTDDSYVQGAMRLLQDTMDGYSNLSVDILLRKMQLAKTAHWLCLYLYSYADLANQDNLMNPKVSAFFFFRRVHRKNASDNKPWAFCLSVGRPGSPRQARPASRIDRRVREVS